MEKLLILCILILSITPSHAFNVTNSTGYSSLEIVTSISNGDEYLQFKYCQAGTACRNLGPKAKYLRVDLEDQRLHERMQIGYSAVADVGVGIVAAVLAIKAGLAYGLGATVVELGIGSAVTVPTVSAATIDTLNPMEQYRQASTLSNDVLNGEAVLLDSEDELSKFIKRLELILNK